MCRAVFSNQSLHSFVIYGWKKVTTLLLQPCSWIDAACARRFCKDASAPHSFGAGTPASSPTNRGHMISCLPRPSPETGSVSAPPPPPPPSSQWLLFLVVSPNSTPSSSPSGEVLKIMHHLFLKGLCDRFSSPFSLAFFPHCLFFFLPLLLHQRINNQPHIKFCVWVCVKYRGGLHENEAWFWVGILIRYRGR